MADNNADRYGVIGYPVTQSRSPIIHRLFAAQTRQNIQYEALQVPPDKLTAAVTQFRNTGGKGLNVTVPHKQAVVAMTDAISSRAQRAQAVNTLTFKDNRVYGDNTDGVGLIADLKLNLRVPLENATILILGAGGATRGVVGPLLEESPASLMIANRTLAKADAIVSEFSELGPVSACSFDGARSLPAYDIVINATSAGVKGETPPYPKSTIDKDTFCYDMSYGLKPTPFAVWASQQGPARSVMGWGMLVEQAAASFHIWRGVRPDTAAVLKQMTINV